MFKLEMNTDGAAFRDEYEMLDPCASEVCSILWKVKTALENGATSGTLIDVCGNAVGSWSYTDD